MLRRLAQAAPPRGWARVLSDAASKQAILITQRCAERIAQLSERATAARALRVSVEPGGCSGFQYKFTLESAGEHAEDDKIFMQNGAEVVVDECSLQLLRGSTVDFEDDMMKSSFVILGNPQSEAGCGCGSSFAPKE